MSKVYLFLADGFEEIEALTVVDLVRRADINCKTVSINGTGAVKGAHNITVYADCIFEEEVLEDGDMLILPGGTPGTNALMAHEGIRELLFSYRNAEKWLAAICAAPSVLGMNGLLRGKRVTCYPGYEDKLLGARTTGNVVETDGLVITGKGAGTAIEFSLAIIKELCGEEKATEIASAIQYVKG